MFSASASKNCPQPRPRAFVIGMSSKFLLWPRENGCNDGTGNHCELAMIINQSYLDKVDKMKISSSRNLPTSVRCKKLSYLLTYKLVAHPISFRHHVPLISSGHTAL